jgi:signal transduction histidine kinase
MQKQLLDAFAERTRFLSAISHDLRSPLTRLRLRAEMLPDPVWRERLRGDLDDMESMVRATLDAVQGIEVTEPRERIDLYSMLESVVADAIEAGHDAAITGASGCIVEGFPRNLKRCIQNLVDNAIRYGHQARVTLIEQSDNVQVVVADRGPGIADEHLIERVFEPYFRIGGDGAPHGHDDGEGRDDTESRDARETPPSGTGLGLTIAQSVARVHGGSLTLRNRVVDGTITGLEAVLTLPV